MVLSLPFRPMDNCQYEECMESMNAKLDYMLAYTKVMNQTGEDFKAHWQAISQQYELQKQDRDRYWKLQKERIQNFYSQTEELQQLDMILVHIRRLFGCSFEGIKDEILMDIHQLFIEDRDTIPGYVERVNMVGSNLKTMLEDNYALQVFDTMPARIWYYESKKLVLWEQEIEVFSTTIQFCSNLGVQISILCYELGLRYHGLAMWPTGIGTSISDSDVIVGNEVRFPTGSFDWKNRLEVHDGLKVIDKIHTENSGVQNNVMRGLERSVDVNPNFSGWMLEFEVLSFISSYQIQYSRMPNTYCYAYCEVMVTWDVEILKWPTGIGTCMGYHILHYIQDTEKGKKLEATIRNLLHYGLVVKMGAVKKLKQTILLLVHYGGLLANLYDTSAQHKKENQELIKQVYTALCQSKFKFGVAIVFVIWDLRHCLVVSFMTEIEALILYGVKDMEAMFSQCEQQMRTTMRVVKKYDPNAKPLPNQLKNSSFEWNGKAQVSYGDAIKNWTQFLANLPWNYLGIRSRAQNQLFDSLVGYMTNTKSGIEVLSRSWKFKQNSFDEIYCSRTGICMDEIVKVDEFVYEKVATSGSQNFSEMVAEWSEAIIGNSTSYIVEGVLGVHCLASLSAVFCVGKKVSLGNAEFEGKLLIKLPQHSVVIQIRDSVWKNMAANKGAHKLFCESLERKLNMGNSMIHIFNWSSNYMFKFSVLKPSYEDRLSEALISFGASSTNVNGKDGDQSSNEIGINSIYADCKDVNGCISSAVDAIGGTETPSYEVKLGDQSEWIQPAQKSFRRIEGLWTVPEWAHSQDLQATNILLNLGLAIGNGEHTTTKLCISLLHGLIKVELFLDYGTGSENLVIATLKFGAANVQTYKFPWDPGIWGKMIYKLILHYFIEILLQHQSWDPGIQYYDFTTLRTRLISTGWQWNDYKRSK